MRPLAVFVVAIVVSMACSSPILDWGKKDGSSLLNKVADIKQTVYEKKREFLNGINEKVSRALWIPPLDSSTTTETIGQEASIVTTTTTTTSETPSLWWWQTTAKPLEPTLVMTTTTVEPPKTSTTQVDAGGPATTSSRPPLVVMTTTTVEPTTTSTTQMHSSDTVTTTSRPPLVQLEDDRLVFTMADTNELEIPIVAMYARSNFIPPELMLTDSVEYTGPVHGRGGPEVVSSTPSAPDRTSRLIML